MTIYEDLLQAHHIYQGLLNSQEKVDDENWFQSKNSIYTSIKSSVEQWFHENTSVMNERIDDTKSHRSTYSGASRMSRASNQLSAAKLKEEQRKAELQERMKALGEKKKIEEENMRLKLKEDELELKIELGISDAKSRVISELERSMVEDQELEDHLQQHKHVSPVLITFMTNSVLNPDSTSFVPKQTTETVSHVPNSVQFSSPLVSQNINLPNYPSNFRDVDTRNQSSIPSQSMISATALDTSNSFSAVSKELNKPKAEIQKFVGNPMDYQRFIRQFNARVCFNTDSYEERLNFLLQFTVGEANKIVSGYSHLNAERGYHAALAEFKERYGDPEVVAQAYVKRALDWPVIRDNARALDEFGIFLRECQFAVENIDAARVLEYSENIKLLVKKLPFYLHERWRNIVYDIRDKKQVVKFENLVAFVRKEAKKAVDPVYGKEVLSGKVVTGTQSQGKRSGHALSNNSNVPRKTLVTVTEENSQGQLIVGCLYCNGSHPLHLCSMISEKQLDDRYAFLKSKGLCFGCLKSGHLRGKCKRKLKCSKCGKPHPSILHANLINSETAVKSVESNQESVPLVSSSSPNVDVTSSAAHMGAGHFVQQALPMVPVRLKSKFSENYLETYAFLDTGSTATFCSESVMKLLNLDGNKTRINLHTMGEEKMHNTFVIKELEICSLDGVNVIDLPPVFTQPTLPVSKNDLISVEDLQRWPHLNKVRFSVLIVR